MEKRRKENKLFFPMHAENCSLGRGWNSFFRSSRKGKLKEHEILDITLTSPKGMFVRRCIKPFLRIFFFIFHRKSCLDLAHRKWFFYTIIGKLVHFSGFP
eukprot:TRINITY_DN17308_c0_g1_i1.p1 TRINITY_DN17308_c0_g1~~TRINITY_DN17308_c0_g1_i1.p1  ORF type:complete len:100 (-),score=2.23 TRINITY_DN17308_c0_g1_i1:822-1121(-)